MNRNLLKPAWEKRGFTLVELLVVIAVIALLAGMLLPALNAAREKGRGTSCLGNLKQIATANLMYAGDNEEYSVPYSVTDSPDPNQPGYYWFGIQKTDKMYDITDSPLLGSYYGYAANVMVCPVTRAEHVPDLTAAEFGGGGHLHAAGASKLPELPAFLRRKHD